MGKFIVKLGEHYLEWSTVVDAPVTFGMSLAEFKEYYRWENGERGMKELVARLERVEKKGTSSFTDVDAEDTISINRAGPNETELTRHEIHQAYCLRKPVKGGWLPK